MVGMAERINKKVEADKIGRRGGRRDERMREVLLTQPLPG